MNCEDFSEWLQVQLDERSDIVVPSEMMNHLNDCDSCRGQVDAWNRIASVMPNDSATIVAPTPSPSWSKGRLISIVASVAAILLIAFLVGRGDSNSPDSSESVAMVTNTTQATADNHLVAVADSDVNPVVIWKQLQARDWLGETMPTVQSVREGMAPLGRSFSTAVNILTMGNRERPS